MKKFIYVIALVISTSAIFSQDEQLEVKGNVLQKDQVNSLQPPMPVLDVPQSVSIITVEDIRNQGFRQIEIHDTHLASILLKEKVIEMRLF